MLEGLEEACRIASQYRDAAENEARLASEVVPVAGAAGLWVAAAPVEVGGLELGLARFLEVCERLAVADPTVTWHVVNSGGAGHAAAFVPESVRNQVFATTGKPYGFSGAPAAGIDVARTADGYRLDGTWPFMTGVLDAEWACVLVVAPPLDNTTGRPDVRRMFMPLNSCEVHPTWDNASSMRGTGSHAVSANRVEIPFEATISMDARPLIDRTSFRVPSHLPFVGGAAATTIGILRSTISGVIELCAHKVSRIDGHKHFDDPRVQQYIADATAAADSLSANLQTRAEQLELSYAANNQPPEIDRARYWAAVFQTAEAAADQVSKLYRIATSSAYGTRNPVERGLRDAHAINATLESFQSLRRAAGAVLLGQKNRHPLL